MWYVSGAYLKMCLNLAFDQSLPKCGNVITYVCPCHKTVAHLDTVVDISLGKALDRYWLSYIGKSAKHQFYWTVQFDHCLNHSTLYF